MMMFFTRFSRQAFRHAAAFSTAAGLPPRSTEVRTQALISSPGERARPNDAPFQHDGADLLSSSALPVPVSA